MTDLDLIWRKHAAAIPGLLKIRPSFRFDPHHYSKGVPVPADDPSELMRHYEKQGRADGRTPNLYAQIGSQSPSLEDVLSELIIDADLVAVIEAKLPGAQELAFELIHLGTPVDSNVSDFSMDTYLRMHPDIQKAGVDPLVHYLFHGFAEGRRILRDIRTGQYGGRQPYRPELPTCLIAVHECSRTGAPIVGLDLAREAALTHNVIVSALRDGPLLEDFRETACQVLITSAPFQDFDSYAGAVLKKIDFAIVNSAVSWQFIPLLVAKDVPFAGYVHEYAEYLHPAFHFNLFPMFADLMVFSSDHVRRSWHGRMADINFNATRDSKIIPQRPFYRGSVTAEMQMDARARLSQLIGRDLSKSRILCGAGQSQWRKGTDIFAMTAQICQQRDSNTVFIWIGHSIVPDELGFGAYMAHHLKEIGAGKQDSNLYFILAGPAYRDVLTASDAMFLSSRLDPLPNVVFDALEHGCRIVQFDGATGFNDELYVASDSFVTVEYGNPEAAATAIQSLPAKKAVETAPEKPDFHLFDEIRRSLHERLCAQRYFVRGSSQFDIPVLYNPEPEFAELRTREREKMLRYGRRRVWRDLDEVKHEIASSDNWVHRTLRVMPYASCSPASLPRFSMHIHAYYTDELAEDLQSYSLYNHARRIVVTTDTEKKRDAIGKIMAAKGLSPEILLVSNTGRDILPFMALFEEGGAGGADEFWCHLHQKKSIGSADHHRKWRRFLMRILLGDTDKISNAVTILAQKGIGLVAPFDPHFVGWNEARNLLPKFADRLPGPMPTNPLLFPVGNMFWTRRSVVLAMKDVFGQNYPWPNEPIANDGTEYHLIERLWPAMAAHLGLDSVFVHKLDEKRM